MRQFLEFVRKEFLHLSRDWRTLIVLVGMPIAQMLIFGYAIRTEVSDADIAVHDKSNDALSRSILQKLSASKNLNLKAILQSQNQYERLFKSGKVKQIIILENNIEFNLNRNEKINIQIINDGSDPNSAKILNSYSTQIINDAVMDYTKERGIKIVEFVPAIRMFYNSELKSVYMFVPGLIVIILTLISTLMTSIAITREKEQGNMEILLVSPLKPMYIIIGKVVPYFFIALANALTVLILSQLVYEVPFRGSILFFTIATIIYIFLALSLGILISTVSKTQQAALMISLAGLLMPTVLLSGFIFPLENMPWVLRVIGNVVPASWYLVIVKSIMLKGGGFELLWKELLILTGMMLFLLGISIKKFKVRL